MSISTNYCVSPNTMVNFKSQKNEKKMSPIAKGALYGATIGAGVTGASMGFIGLVLKGLSVACKTTAEKRDFISKLGDVGKRKKCFSKTLKDGLKALKTWKPWAKAITVGAALGALIGCFKKEK